MSGDTFIHRGQHTSNFVSIGNELAQSRELSFGAKGLMLELLSKPVDWKFNLEWLSREKHGRDSVRKLMMELRAAGHVVAAKRREGGLYHSTEYHVFEFPRTAEQIAALCAERGVEFSAPAPDACRPLSSWRAPTKSKVATSAGTSGPGDSDTTKTDCKKDRGHKRDIPKGISPAADATGANDDDFTGLNPGDLALLERNREECASPDFSAPPIAPPPARPATPSQASVAPAPAAETLALFSEDEPNGQTFPWRQLMSTVKRIVPEVVMPSGAARRDHVMKQFWRKHGKTVGCFERLATLVAESDFIMARGGHTGNSGRPYSWGWIFSKDDKGRLRADRIMDGEFSNEKMLWVLEKKAKEAAPKSKRVYLIGAANSSEITPDEKMEDGRPRYRLCEETRSGLPVYLDRGGRT